MSNDLHQALHDTTEELTLDRPVTDVVARGERIRRRRRRVTLGGAAAVLAGAAALSVALPQGSSPLVPEAQAAWGPHAVNLTADQIEVANDTCRYGFRPSKKAGGYKLPVGAQPIVADERDGLALLVYVVDGVMSTCNLVRDGAGYAPSGGSWDEVEPLDPGVHVSFVSANAAIGTPDKKGRLIYSPDGPISQAYGVLEVSDDVERMDVTIAGTTVEAALHEGFALFWLPDGHSQDEFDATTIVAYDGEGAELATGNMFNQPPVPADGGRSITDEEEGRY